MPQLENFRLKVFRAVAENLNFRKAAEQLLISQPAVTLQIKALENDLGVRLFDRTAGHISLTPHGAVLAEYAKRIASLVSEAEQKLGLVDHKISGELALGVSTTIAQYVLPKLLGAFLEGHPHVQFSLLSGNTSRVVHYLLDGKIALGLIEGPTRAHGVRTEPFMEDELVLIAPRNWQHEHLSPEQFRACTLLMREHGSGSRRVVEMALEKAGFKLKSFKNVMNLDSTEAIKSAVEAGLGLGFVSRWAISKELELDALKVVSLRGIEVTRHFSLIRRSGPEPQGPAGALRTFALDRARLLSQSARASARRLHSTR